MAVIVQYIVERNGVQKMTFTDKKEADQYDKMLDIADSLYDFIGEADLAIEDDVRENLSLYLAKNSDDVTALLKGSKQKPKAAPKKKAEAKMQENEGETSEPAAESVTQEAVATSESAESETEAA